MGTKTKLAGILGNGMVIQRDQPFKIWGSDVEAKFVKVFLEKNEYVTMVSGGRFVIELPAHEAATDITITVKGSEEIVLNDICFGDVYMLAGQSNMELPVYRTLDVTSEEVEASDYPYIRQFRLTPNYRLDDTKTSELFEAPWVKAVPGDIMDISAVGFFCAKELYEATKVPIGLVLSAQGGSTLEAWLPADSLAPLKDCSELINKFKEDNAVQRFLENMNNNIANWRKAITPEGYEENSKAIPSDAVEVTLPGLVFDKNSEGYTGSLWLYKEIELDVEPEADSFLYVGELIDSDITYINGEVVGRTEYCYPPRKYPFDGSILKKGKNLIAVRLIIDHKYGGFLKDHQYYLRTGDTKIDITGTWLMKKETAAQTEAPEVIMGQTIPTALYTASVKPILNLKFKGVWWYQGESNAGDPFNKNSRPGKGYFEAASYDKIFKVMIERWRQDFKQELPIVVVEMPDYTNPVEGWDDGWAELQKMQRSAPEMVENCRVALGKDLGEPYELHPQNKSILGKRMAEEVKRLNNI